jgi:hypothetical protein
MPNHVQIQEWIDACLKENPNLYVDYNCNAMQYYQESNTHSSCTADLLGAYLRTETRFDMILLDSAGHLGYLEFKCVLENLKYPCFIALDDTLHLKHWKTMQTIKADPRFVVLYESAERYGSAVARFTP